MSDFKRQHPVAALSRAFGLIRGNIVTIIVFLFVGAQSESFSFLWWTLGGFAFLLIVGFAKWWRFLYKVEDGLIHIKSGIFVRKNLYLTKDRIQVIDITAGIIQRIFGLVQLDIQTAGASSRAASIEAITRDRAEAINRLLRRKREDSGEEDNDGAEFEIEDDIKQTISLPNKELLIAASTSGSFGIALSVIGTVFSQIEPLISESQFYDYLYSILPSQTDTMFYFALIAGFIVFAWLLSFFGTLFNYGNFSLEIKEKEIVISRGIFEKKRSTVPFNRIQAIHISEGIIRQPLGYASIHLESAAGYGDDRGTGSILFFPLIKRKRILSLLDEVLPDYQKELAALKPPIRSLRRYIFRSTFLVTAVTAGVWWWFDLNVLMWIFPILAIIWGWLKYNDTALGWGDDILVLQSRNLSKSTAYIKKKRVQDATISQSPFQRYRNLCSVQVYVASGDRGKSFNVRDVELEDGLTVLEQIRIEGVNTTLDESLESETERQVIQLPGWA
ncbi:MAG: PH domain-containing protein [Balneolaceae bacterium]|nr:PH domain-containing protein [Balneolaceae bacterium]